MPSSTNYGMTWNILQSRMLSNDYHSATVHDLTLHVASSAVMLSTAKLMALGMYGVSQLHVRNYC